MGNYGSKKGWLIGLGSIVAIIVLWVWVVPWLTTTTYSAGTTTSSQPIGAFQKGQSLSWVGTTLQLILGIPGDVTPQNLALHLAIVFILLFAFYEIMVVFSFFSDVASWMISLGLVIIVGVTGATASISTIFAATARLGAIGIGIVILTAILAVVTLHLSIGDFMRKWRMSRAMEVESAKSGYGAAQVKSAITGLKEVEAAFVKGKLKP